MKFLANALFKGSLTVDNGVTLTNGKNITTTNQLYVLASNYANGIAVGYDSAAVYLGYSMGTTPIHLGSNGSGNLVVRTTGNTVIENGALVVGQASPESGTKLTVNGNVSFKNGYVYGGAANGGDFGLYPDSGYYEFSSPTGANQGPILILNCRYTGKQVGFYSGDTTYPGMLLYEQAPVGGDLAYWTTTTWAMTSSHNLVWASTTGGIAIAQGPYDIGLTREAAGVLQVNNGTVGTYANLKLAGLTASSLAGTGTRMVVASSTGVLSTQAIPSATGLQTAVDTDKSVSSSLAVGTSTVKSVSASTYSGVFFDYVVKNGTNVRVGSVVAITNGTDIEYYETLSNDIGTTTGITFAADLSGGNIRLRATTTATGWTVIVSTRGI